MRTLGICLWTTHRPRPRRVQPGHMTNRPASSCTACTHFHGLGDGWPSCDAFPIGIEFEVLAGDISHLEPLPGDNGIQWAPVDGAPPVLRLIPGSG